MGPEATQRLFTEFFRDLAIAWRALSGYPDGHPAAVAGLGKACAALGNLLAETGPITLAAARDALHWNGQRFASPTASQLAKLLRRRRAASVALDPGVSPPELDRFLRALSLDVKSARNAGSLATELADAGLVRLRVSDLDFSNVALVEGDEEVTAPEAGAFSNRVLKRLLAGGALPADQLASWIASGRSASDLLHHLFDFGAAGGSGGGAPADSGTPRPAFAFPPELLAAALEATAEELTAAPGSAHVMAFAALHQRLGEADRQRLLAALAVSAGRQVAARETLAQLTEHLPPSLAAEFRRAIGRAALASPETAAAGGSPPAPRSAPQLAGLRAAFASEDLDPLREIDLPEAGRDLLFELPEDEADFVLDPGATEVAREITGASADRAIADVLLELALDPELAPELLAPMLSRLEQVYRRLLAGGRIRHALGLVGEVQKNAAGDDARATAFRRAAERLAGRESLAALVGALPELTAEALAIVPRLLDQLGPTAVRHLIGALAETDNRRLRHLLLDLLARLGPAVVRDATTLLGDGRWYVVRNMLLLLRRVGDPGSVPAVRRCADHPDLRVRLEAIRNLFAFDKEVPRELLRRALTHRDPRQAEAAMELAGEHGIVEAIEPIVAYLRAHDLLGWRRGVRLKALRALAAIGDPVALAGLDRFRARFQLLPPAIEERRELYRTLRSYPQAARQPWIDSGLRSRDAEIRRLSETLARSAEPAVTSHAAPEEAP